MRQTSLDMVQELARRDERVVFLGSDLGAGTMEGFKQEFPSRWFMEGVAEQNLIGMAAGLALEGFIPYLNTIATFLTRRCYEQIAIDLCLHKLPVRLLASGGGLVYSPLGPTHLAIEDIAIMRVLPEMTVIAPADASEMRQVMEASLTWKGPLYIRLGRGGDPILPQAKDFVIGQASWVRPAARLVFMSTGVMSARCLPVLDLLDKEGIACGLLHVPTIKPLDAGAVLDAARAAELIVTVEDHVLSGGLGAAVLELLADQGQVWPAILRLGLPPHFPVKYGSQEDLLRDAGLQPEQIFARVMAALARQRR
jgi:transketolase